MIKTLSNSLSQGYSNDGIDMSHCCDEVDDCECCNCITRCEFVAMMGAVAQAYQQKPIVKPISPAIIVPTLAAPPVEKSNSNWLLWPLLLLFGLLMGGIILFFLAQRTSAAPPTYIPLPPVVERVEPPSPTPPVVPPVVPEVKPEPKPLPPTDNGNCRPHFRKCQPHVNRCGIFKRQPVRTFFRERQPIRNFFRRLFSWRRGCW